MTSYPTKFTQISGVSKKAKKEIENIFPFIPPNSNLGNLDLCGQLVSKSDNGSNIKFCPICDNPMIVKMLILPCEHVMCYSCSQPEKGYCYICENKIESINRINDNAKLYECDYPDCFKFFLSNEKLNAHKITYHIGGHIDPAFALMQNRAPQPIFAMPGMPPQNNVPTFN